MGIFKKEEEISNEDLANEELAEKASEESTEESTDLAAELAEEEQSEEEINDDMDGEDEVVNPRDFAVEIDALTARIDTLEKRVF